jgi:hypothetical protein
MAFLTKILPIAALAATLAGGILPAQAAGLKGTVADVAEAVPGDDVTLVGDRHYYGPRGYYGPPPRYYRPPPPRYYYPPPRAYYPPPRVYYPPPPPRYYAPPPGVGLYFRF